MGTREKSVAHPASQNLPMRTTLPRLFQTNPVWEVSDNGSENLEEAREGIPQ